MYCGRVDVDGGDVTGIDVGRLVVVCVGVNVGAGVFVVVAVAVGLGDKVALGDTVNVGAGVNVSPAGWKGVGVALAFGSTVTRLMDGEDAGGFDVANVQDARSVKPQSTLSARRVRIVILVPALGGVPRRRGKCPERPFAPRGHRPETGYGGLRT